MENVSITVEIDELIQRLKMIQEDGCEYTTLEIRGDNYDTELYLKGHDPDSNEPVEYGSLPNVSEEM